MFENIYGMENPKDLDDNLIATGHYVEDSHYIVVLQDSKGYVIDLSVTELSFG